MPTGYGMAASDVASERLRGRRFVAVRRFALLVTALAVVGCATETSASIADVTALEPSVEALDASSRSIAGM